MTIFINNVNDSKLREFLALKNQESNFISIYPTCFTSFFHLQKTRQLTVLHIFKSVDTAFKQNCKT